MLYRLYFIQSSQVYEIDTIIIDRETGTSAEYFPKLTLLLSGINTDQNLRVACVTVFKPRFLITTLLLLDVINGTQVFIC